MIDAFATLAREPIWCLWREEDRGGRVCKLPFSATGKPARVDDPTTWAPRDVVESAARQFFGQRREHGGIGSRLGDLGGDNYLVGINLNNCLVTRMPEQIRDVAGWARPIIAAFASYGEVSPSAHGLHLLALMSSDDVRQFLDRLGVESTSWGLRRYVNGGRADDAPTIEIYCAGRYFTVTEDHWPATPTTINLLDADHWARLVAAMPADATDAAPPADDDEPINPEVVKLREFLKYGGPGPLWIDTNEEEWAEADTPQRPWVVKHFALRGAVTLFAGPPSAMKSSLALAWACSVVLGRPHAQFKPAAPGTVIVYNVEDDKFEQRRRLSAAFRQFDASRRDIAGKLILTGPNGLGSLLTRNPLGTDIIPTPTLERLRALFAERRPALFIADPFSELHGENENDNVLVRLVIVAFRMLAQEFNCAIILLHHTRKGIVAPGDIDAIRGGSSIIGASRLVLTVTTMTEDEAEAFGIDKSREVRSRYFRVDDGRQSYGPINAANWYEKKVYLLDNGEDVPAAEPWTPPDIWESVPVEKANRILDDIAAGPPGEPGYQYSGAAQSRDRAACDLVMQHCPALNRTQAQKVIAAWLKSGALIKTEYRDPRERRTLTGLAVDAGKRPGNTYD